LLVLHRSIEDFFRARLLTEGYSRREEKHEEIKTHRNKNIRAKHQETNGTATIRQFSMRGLVAAAWLLRSQHAGLSISSVERAGTSFQVAFPLDSE
jgi:hypothetical protein